MKLMYIKFNAKKTVACLSIFCMSHILCGVALAESLGENSAALNKTASNKAGFGRLFTSPNERALLDSQRKKYGFLRPVITSVDAEAKGVDIAPAATQPLKLSGILLRADGQQQIWINGKLQPQQKNSSNNQATKKVLPTSAALNVPIKQQDQYTKLKPGQVWNPNNRKTTESYLLPVSKPPQVEVPVKVKKPAMQNEVVEEKSTAQPTSESTGAAQ